MAKSNPAPINLYPWPPENELFDEGYKAVMKRIEAERKEPCKPS